MKEWTKILQQQTGTGRFNRLPKALLPTSAPIDERTLPEMLAFVARYAKEVVFADLAGKNDSSWATILGNDSSLFLAEVSSYRLDKVEQELRRVAQAFDTINFSLDYQDKANAYLQELIDICLALIFQIDDWYRQAARLRTLNVKAVVQQLFAQHIHSELGRQVRQLYAYCLSDEALIKRWQIKAEQAQILHRDWSLQRIETQSLFQGDAYSEQFSFAVKEVQLILRKIIASTTSMVQAAPLLLQRFLSERQNHAPDIGLLITFLKLFQKAQQHLNKFTERHLDYYYYDRLHLQQRMGKPSQAIVHFRLSPLLDRYRLTQHSLLSAGEDDQGIPFHYQTDRKLHLSSARICQLKALFIAQNNMYGIGSSYKLVSNIYHSTVEINEDYEMLMGDKTIKHWALFGEDQLNIPERKRQMQNAPLGIALATSLLYLQDGERELTFKFHFAPNSTITFENLIKDIAKNRAVSVESVITKLLGNAFHITLSGRTEWIAVEKYAIAYDQIEKVLQLNFTLSQDIPPIAPFDAEQLLGNYPTNHPVIRILSTLNGTSLIYSFIKDLELDKVEIMADVKRHSTLTLYNEYGLLDNSGTTLPFSPVPQQNSYFLLGSVELFNKDITNVAIDLEWSNPLQLAGGFAEYYAAYPQEINNDSFKIGVSALSKYQFIPQRTPQMMPLFESDGQQVANKTRLTAIDLSRLDIEPDYQLEAIPDFSNQAKIGYLRLELCEPAMAFGQKEFPNLFAKAALTNSQTSFFNWGKKAAVLDLPNEPYIPTLKRVTIDYQASTTLHFNPQDSVQNDSRKADIFIQLYPFGKRIIRPGKVIHPTLIPQFAANGYLYIGLQAVLPDYPLSLFFGLISSQEEVQSTTLKTDWAYLVNNQWQPLAKEALLSDSTKSFTQSGIVRLQIPNYQTSENTILPNDLFWLRIAAHGELKAMGRLQKIVPHVVTATRVIPDDPNLRSANNQHEPIVELAQTDAAIDLVQQVTPYYGYQRAEDKKDFYLRISERLRHKNRAVTIWDYERLVLQAFPYLKQVKCLGYTNNEEFLTPGAVRVVVIPKGTSAAISPKVGFNQLQQIQTYLKTQASYHADIKVVNPLYEPVVVNAAVIFKTGEQDSGKYLNLLYEAITDFICPWRKRGAVFFNKKIKKNELLSQLEKLPFVHFISGFSLVGVVQQQNQQYEIIDTAAPNENTGFIAPSTPWSVFVPAKKHNIQLMKKAAFVVAERTSIDSMRVGTDFIIMADETETEELIADEMEEDYFTF